MDCADSGRKACNKIVYLGVDVGSTTTKVVALDARSRSVLHSVYERHHAHQIESLKPLIADVGKRFLDASFKMALSGSGGKSIASFLGVPYVQRSWRTRSPFKSCTRTCAALSSWGARTPR